MRTSTSIPCIIFILVGLIFASVEANDRDKMKLKGAVKSVTVMEYEVRGKPDHPVKGDIRATTSGEYNYSLFDSLTSRLTELKTIGRNYEIISRKTYKYDKDSIIEISVYTGNDQISEKIKYKRDQENRLTETRFYDARDELKKTFTQQFNTRENSMTWQVLDEKGDLNKYLAVPQEIFYYDQNNLITHVDHYTYSNPTTMIKATRSAWKYNKENDPVTYTDYYKNEGIQKQVSWFYSEKGMLDSLSENEFLFSGDLKKSTMVTFDKNENPVKKIIFEPEINKTENWSYKYDYDASGNWIKSITFLDQRPVSITERKIEYYNIPVQEK